jgi:hypothetical protein
MLRTSQASPADEVLLPVEAIVKVIDRYQGWLERGDIIQVQRAWAECVPRWQALSDKQRAEVEKLRPGTRKWMESGSDYEEELFNP